MRTSIILKTPLKNEEIAKLKAGDSVSISGVIYSFRDAAHKKLIDLIIQKKPLPFNLSGQIVYYMGPSPAKPGAVIGAAGPTTSSRMDVYTQYLLEQGLAGMIGKGSRSMEVKQALKKYKAVYFAAIGGAGAYLSQRIKKAEVIAFSDLGPEAIRRLEVENFPAIVINDIFGEDLYQQTREKYKL